MNNEYMVFSAKEQYIYVASTTQMFSLLAGIAYNISMPNEQSKA